MNNPQKVTRSGASQASSTDSTTNGDNYSNTRSGHRNRLSTPGGSAESEGNTDQSHTAGGTSSDQPRQVDQQ